jgi:hypothetical protein
MNVFASHGADDALVLAKLVRIAAPKGVDLVLCK